MCENTGYQIFRSILSRACQIAINFKQNIALCFQLVHLLNQCLYLGEVLSLFVVFLACRVSVVCTFECLGVSTG